MLHTEEWLCPGYEVNYWSTENFRNMLFAWLSFAGPSCTRQTDRQTDTDTHTHNEHNPCCKGQNDQLPCFH